MKAQRRHELHENVLAQELGNIRSFYKRYGNWITALLVAVLVVVLVVWHYRSRSAAELAEQSALYETLKRDIGVPDKQASALEGLIDLAENARDPLLSASASMFAADFCSEQYVTGMRRSDGKPVDQYRAKAEKYYRLVIENNPDRKVFVARAHLGLGMLAESAANWTTARSEYNLVQRLLDESFPVSAEAQRRLNILDAWSKPFRFATIAPTTEPAATAPTSKPSEAKTQPTSKPTEADAKINEISLEQLGRDTSETALLKH
ncbi:MAG: tetratricopeptide repeat protein [Planctomycetota bacterium]|nr:tetratricopeptide repeat protein [Planctomycetota bacterium]